MDEAELLATYVFYQRIKSQSMLSKEIVQTSVTTVSTFLYIRSIPNASYYYYIIIITCSLFNDVDGSHHGIIYGTILAHAWRDRGKQRKTSVWTEI
jgi:hypothetical protein